MTLGENKKIALGLIEEYDPTNPLLTSDEDISTRLNLVYATRYQELSELKRILKTKVLKEITGETSEGYEEISLPANMYIFKKIIGLDENNNEVGVHFKRIGKNKIYISKEDDIKVILEYYIYPSVINVDTSDDFVLEIDQDVQMVLPWGVANDVLKVDPSQDYTAFYNEYMRRMESLNLSDSTTGATVEEGVL